MCITSKLYSCRRKFHRAIQAGGLDFGLFKIISIGLQFVYNLNDPPYKYVCCLSTAQTIPRASRSVCEYRHSVGVKALLTVVGESCDKIAERPTGDASVMTSDSLCGIEVCYDSVTCQGFL